MTNPSWNLPDGCTPDDIDLASGQVVRCPQCKRIYDSDQKECPYCQPIDK